MVDASLAPTQEAAFSAKFKAVIRLSRWREHVPFTIPLTVGGAMLAVSMNDLAIDWRIVLVTLANILAVSFAFMINDLEDAPDDALNPKKRAHNVISSGILSYREGMIVTWATFLLSLALYGLSGVWTLSLGLLTLVLSYLYSAYPFRWKARPVTDVVSHALMLSALLIMVGYFTYHQSPGVAWYMIAAAFLFSAYGQFYNQIDDYDVDKAAGLRNTVVLLGKLPTTILMYASAIGAIACMAVAVISGAFPAWLGTVVVIVVFTCGLFVWETDMRGNPSDGSGSIQKPVLMVANIVMLLWVSHHLGLMAGI